MTRWKKGRWNERNCAGQRERVMTLLDGCCNQPHLTCLGWNGKQDGRNTRRTYPRIRENTCLDLDKTQNVGSKEATKQGRMVGQANCQSYRESSLLTIKARLGKQLAPSKRLPYRIHVNGAQFRRGPPIFGTGDPNILQTNGLCPVDNARIVHACSRAEQCQTSSGHAQPVKTQKFRWNQCGKRTKEPIKRLSFKTLPPFVDFLKRAPHVG